MTTSRLIGPNGQDMCRRRSRRTGLPGVWLALALGTLAGCGKEVAPATVEGTLRCQGKPLDNCLITFLPEAGPDTAAHHSTGLTDAQGVFRLRFVDQQEGVIAGWHRVTVQDLSVSTGVRRRDNGTIDATLEDTEPPPAVRPSRVPESYAIVSHTPLRTEVQTGHQVIDLEIK